MSAEPKAAFLLRRAEEEAILALRTDQAPAADSHRELSIRYSARAREVLSADGDGDVLTRDVEVEGATWRRPGSEFVSVLLTALRGD